ncbi:hypothetical protein AQUCO_00100009v1 [Aquilegia coerulea]|uniref:Uncharacterized protein n=1 Tax=Aquilegia coerulea TaxID=218851 RepID=A0A2G5F889_AQUCA|nr:hypothetical protein AQUCO_00100009v1 [Aquilegia coerulea]
MAEALVSAVLEHLVTPAIEQVTEEVRLVRSVGNEIKSLVEELAKIKSLLEDAEKKQIHDKSVKAWFEELKGIAYDVDDVLDEWHTRILQQIATNDDSSTSKQNKKKVFACFSSPFNRSQPVLVRYRIAHRIKDLRQQLDTNAKIIPGLQLIASQASHHHEDLPSRQIISSFVDPSKIHGRDHEKAEIMSWLRSQQEAKVSVMSVVGTPGFGKTALVQLVFHQENDKNTFDPTMWVSVSEPVDLQRLAKEIIESATGKKPEVDGLEALLRHLSDTVKGKMFMLILDDVWPKYLEHWWEQLKSSLDSGAQGSKIIITTRYQKVADVVESSCIILLRELQYEACWSLFKRIAFSRRSANNHHNLEGIGEEIVKKCKGVPLAIKTIASLMQYKQTIHEWESVRDSDVWEHVGEKLLPSLLLSYHAFPSYLKQCFMYCAVIPKDTLMKKDTLVKLWMAQGFLGSNGGKELETVGGAYFDELAMRSFFQDFEKDGDGSVVSCKIHDLVHDFAQSLTITECCVIQMNDKETCNSKVRHLTAPDTENPSISKVQKNLRTLITLSLSDSTDVCKLFRQLTCLRTLDLSGSHFKELPKEVELLLHLRYLDLSRTKLTELPESLCKLYNLQTLKLDYCFDLPKLPNGIGELSNLRHIENKETYELKYFPKGIERLSCLRTLNKFVVSGATGGCRIGELGNLIHLGGDLEIRGLWQVENMIEAKQAGLQEKKNLDSLLLDFDGGEFRSAEDREKMEGVLKGLQPHNNLKTLEIYEYPGLTVNLEICIHLRHLNFSYCRNITSLPADLGKLQFLESLDVDYAPEIKDVSFQLLKISGNGDSSSLELFPKLQFLKLSNLRKWEEEEEENEKIDRFSIMPCLLELEIVFCPKLKVLPHYMMFSQTLRKLRIHNCPRLSGMKPCLPSLLEELRLWGDVGVLSSSLMPIIHNNNNSNNSYPNLKSVIIDFSKNSSLPQGLNQFTSLQKLHLSYCESLDFKPEEEFRHLHTLPTLTITIYNCPLLKERSSRDDWANLSNFPKIIFQ